MSYLSNIPQAIFNNILLLGILWMAYQFAEHVLKLGTKKLFVLEGNLGGNVWVFSHKKSFALEKYGRFNLLNQFNAFDVAADVLIKKTKELSL